MTAGKRPNYIEYARNQLRVLRIRNNHFAQTNIFGDPAWEMVLEALIAAKENRCVRLAELARDLRKPISIMVRLTNIMEAEGHIEQYSSPNYPGQMCVKLTPDTMAWRENFLERKMGGDDFLQ